MTGGIGAETTALDVYVRLRCAGVGLTLTGSGIASARMPEDPDLRALARTHKAGLMRILLEGAPKVCRRCGLVEDGQPMAWVDDSTVCVPGCLPDGLVHVGNRVARATVRGMAQAIVAGWAFLEGRMDGLRVELRGGHADGAELVTKALARAAVYAEWDEGRRSDAAMIELREIEAALTAAWDAAGRVMG